MSGPLPLRQRDDTTSMTFSPAPVDGVELYWWATERAFASYPGTPPGFTIVATVQNGTGSYHTARLYHRTASGETGVYSPMGTMDWVSEWPAGTTLDDFTTLDDQTGSGNVTAGGPITPSAPDATVVGFGLYGAFFPAGTVTPGVDVVEWFQADAAGGNSPTTWVGYKAVATPASTTVDAVMGNGNVGWAGVTAVFLAAPIPPTVGGIIDFEDDGFTLGDYDDVSADIMDWTITRGAGAEITSGANPGSCVFHLRRKERDGLYNPRNVSGPLYGLLRDGLRVHIAVNNDGTLTPSGTVKGLFAGRVTDITVLPDAGTEDAVVTEFACEDPLAWYQRTPVHIGDSRIRSHYQLRVSVMNAIGESRYSLDSEIGTMPLSAADGDAFAVLGQINAANGTRHFAKPSDSSSEWYRYTTYNRQHKLAGVADASINAGVEHATDTSGWRLSADTVINQQTATVVPTDFPLGVQKVWESEQLPIKVTTETVIWANFTDYVDGGILSESHTGTCATVIESFGHSAKITLTPTGSATFTDLQVFGRPVIRGSAQSYVADDLTSQAGPRGVRARSEISGDYVGVLAMARGIAQHMVWRYGSPQLRPTLTVVNWFPEQFELDLYDVIEFTSLNMGSDAVLYEIVGLAHTGIIASPTVVYHTVVYVLQECRVQSPKAWFTLDSSHLDGTDVLAY